MNKIELTFYKVELKILLSLVDSRLENLKDNPSEYLPDESGSFVSNEKANLLTLANKFHLALTSN